jgi:hypothetical protein
MESPRESFLDPILGLKKKRRSRSRELSEEAHFALRQKTRAGKQVLTPTSNLRAGYNRGDGKAVRRL